MTGAAHARIELSAWRHNLAVARRAARGARVMAAIKADGYGHGLIAAARALSGADAFAVARLEEAVALRNAGFAHRIVLLEGVFTSEQMRVAQSRRLDLVMHDPVQLELLEYADPRRPVTVWIKVDSGMHRLGFLPEEVPEVAERLQGMRAVADSPALLTHLANADARDEAVTAAQVAAFDRAGQGLAGPRSIANSAGLLWYEDSLADWVRPGIMLYGVSPFVGGRAAEQDLAPVMTLASELIAIKSLRAGDPVGYGGTWCLPQDSRIGVVAIGYGDGYPRHAPSGTPVLVNGRRVPLVGRVSMDMVSVDLGPEAEDQVGDPVTLWGEDLPIEEIAEQAGTIAYELLCCVTSRVPRVYV